jgi:hypothetical protein
MRTASSRVNGRPAIDAAKGSALGVSGLAAPSVKALATAIKRTQAIPPNSPVDIRPSFFDNTAQKEQNN